MCSWEEMPTIGSHELGQMGSSTPQNLCQRKNWEEYKKLCTRVSPVVFNWWEIGET